MDSSPSSSPRSSSSSSKTKRWVVPVVISLVLSSLLISTSLLTFSSSKTSTFFLFSFSQITTGKDDSLFVEPKLTGAQDSPKRSPVPRLAYLVSGSSGDGKGLRRTLRALYHPANFYAVHLDLEASPVERLELSIAIRSDRTYARFKNVRVVKKANLVTYRGPTMVTNTLHAAAILLKEGGDWDWFINLSASDYPLVTQDDILYTLANLPRDLNFLEHTSDIGWKEFQRAKPLIIDPGLYSLQKADVFWATEKRSVPSAFKLFTGSAWMVLSHQFIEFCIWGWDNLPRTVLMYYANFLSSPEGYFHTVICNAPEFWNTTVNHDLHFISWDNPPKQHPHFLTLDDFPSMVDSNAPFARKFGRGEFIILDKIDKELLGRDADGFASGGWIDMMAKANVSDPMSFVKNISQLRPGPGAERIKRLITGLVSEGDEKNCI